MATLLGPDGRPIRKRELTREIAGPTIAGVRPLIGDHPTRGLTPSRLATLLRDAEEGDARAYLELAEDMEEKDLHYAAVLGTRKRAVAQLEITVHAASDAAEDMRAAELVEQFLARDELEDELLDILDAIGKGYSITEIVWDTSAGQWMPRRLVWRQPQWFRFDREDGETVLLLDGQGDMPLPPYKFICHRHRAKSGLPIRGGIARAAAWAWLFKNYALKDWVTFAEVYGQPLRVGKYHPGATEGERKTLLKAVSQLGTDAAAIVPESMIIEFVEAQRTGSIDLYERLCDWLDRQVSKAVLGQTLTTEVKGGSLAAARVHDDVRGDIERSDARQLAATLNRDLVRPLVDLNFGPRRWYPRIVLSRPDEDDAELLSRALERLVPLGLKVRASEVRRKLGLDEPDAEDELLGMPPAGDAAGMPAAATRCPGCGETIAAARRDIARAPARDAADRIADRTERAAMDVTDIWIDRIRRLVETSGSIEEISRRLLEIEPEMSAETLSELLGKALVLAELEGRAEILQGL